MQKSNIYVTKDSREMAYYIENGVQPYQLKGYKGVLSAYFYSEDIQDMRENWYCAIKQYKQERNEYNNGNGKNCEFRPSK